MLRANALQSKRTHSLAAYGAAELTAQGRAHRNPLRNCAPGQISTFHPNERYALDKVQRTVQHRRSTAHRKHAVKRTDLSARIVARSSSSRADAPTAVDIVVSAIANAGFGSPPSGTDRLVRGALPALATQTLSLPRKRWRSVPPESSARPSINENESRGREASKRARLIRRTDPTEPLRQRIATMPTNGLASIDVASSHGVGSQEAQWRIRRFVTRTNICVDHTRTSDLSRAGLLKSRDARFLRRQRRAPVRRPRTRPATQPLSAAAGRAPERHCARPRRGANPVAENRPRTALQPMPFTRRLRGLLERGNPKKEFLHVWRSGRRLLTKGTNR